MITMHPGDFLKFTHLDEKNISQKSLADSLNMSTSAVSRLVSGKADMTASMAVALSEVTGVSAEYWMQMQSQHSLRLARERREKTRNAIAELESGDGKRFSTVAGLMDDLDADD